MANRLVFAKGYPYRTSSYGGLDDIIVHISAPTIVHTKQIVKIAGEVLNKQVWIRPGPTEVPWANKPVTLYIDRRAYGTKNTNSEGYTEFKISAEKIGLGTHTLTLKWKGSFWHNPAKDSTDIYVREARPGEGPGEVGPIIGPGILAKLFKYVPYIIIVSVIGVGGYIVYKYIIKPKKLLELKK